jgi:hypothetical protein
MKCYCRARIFTGPFDEKMSFEKLRERKEELVRIFREDSKCEELDARVLKFRSEIDRILSSCPCGVDKK